MNKTIYQVTGAIFLLLVLVKLFNVSYPVNIRVVNSTNRLGLPLLELAR